MSPLSTKKGLTLIGVLISSVIITISFTSFMNLQATLIQYITQSNDEVLSQSLANEALELVRGIRDGNFEQYFSAGVVSTIKWDDGLDRTSATLEKYFIDIKTDRLNPNATMPISTCTTVSQDASCAISPDSSGLYVDSSSATTKYYRYVEIQDIVTAGSEGLGVTATVVVKYQNNRQKVYRAYTELYNTDM
jgi:hypothetical protein